MSLTGSQHQHIQATLLAAFDEAGLRRLVKFELDEELDQIAGGKNLTERAYNLVAWADAHGYVAELVAGVRRQVPNNPEITALEAAAKTWHIDAPVRAEMPPYKGLEFYGVADAALFFGRETLTTELVAFLKSNRFLAVVGASGSGKSSVVRAGVIPALQKGEIVKGSDKWALHVVTPTARPLQALAAELTGGSESMTAQATLMDDMNKDARSLDLFASRLIAKTGAPRLLLVVDQFEELFTLCKDRAEQQVYVDNLLAAAVPEGITSVILTLRADFYARCAEFANLRTALQDYQKYIGPLSREELRAAIEKPAQQNGWDFEQGLVDAILADVEGELGALPLLSHALLETWKRRSGHTLTFAGYHAAGSVQGAIAKTADAVYADLPSNQQAIARNIFLRLTTLGEGTQDTRRRVLLPELLGTGEQALQVQAVLKRLEDERLVTAERAPTPTADAGDRPAAVYVDVTHEALIREWPRLVEWLQEDREGLMVHRRLTEAAQEWDNLQHDAGSLFRGALLAQTAEWATAHNGDLNDLEREFLHASLAQIDAERRRRQRVTAGIVTSSVLFAVAMAVLAVIANNRGIEADNARATALANLSLAQQKLDELKVEELLTSARDKQAQLDVNGAVADFRAAAAAAKARGEVLDVSSEISDTLRFVATRFVQEGERILCQANDTQPVECTPLLTGPPDDAPFNVPIDSAYLEWADEVAPQLIGWSADTSPLQRQAVISATALFSQALALNPPVDAPIYVWIEPGKFAMGSTEEQISRAMSQCEPDTDSIGSQCPRAEIFASPGEQPASEVDLPGYWIQRTEVTYEQYWRYADAGTCLLCQTRLKELAQNPVTHLTVEMAAQYAGWAGGRLPTDPEWEKACRGTDGRIYPWGNDAPMEARLNYYYSSLAQSVNVGSYPSGANGLYDMAGNVEEWTAGGPDGEPSGLDTFARRGGSYYSLLSNVRCAFRNTEYPGHGYGGEIGFRIVSPYIR